MAGDGEQKPIDSTRAPGDARFERALARLRGAPHTLDLASDLPRRKAAAPQPASHQRDLPRGIVALASQLGLELADVLCAAWAETLARYARQDELLLAELVAGQASGQANCVVVRVARSPAQPVGAFAQAVASARSDARSELALPFAELARALGAVAEGGRAALCQASFAAAPVGEAQEVDLALTLDGTRVQFGYRGELFAASTVERLADHTLRLLGRMLESADAPLGSLSLLDAEERRALVEDFNPVEAFPAALCLHTLVARRAAERPDAQAVGCDGRTLSYRELDLRANQLAHRLRRAGVARDVRVGVCMDRSVELIVALLAVLKAGGAYLPLEPTNPKDRLSFVLEDAQAKLVITQSTQREKLPDSVPQELLDNLSALDVEPAEAPEHDGDTSSLAYVIYTSGSTGKPKGCLIEHRAAVRLFEATARTFGFGDQDVWTMFHSVAFDFSVWEIWGALIYGGRLVVVPYTVSRSPDDFYRLCVEERVTVLNQTPSAFRQLIAAEARTGERPLALRWVVFGGEALEFESLRPWFTRHGDRVPTLVNMYGITETTVHVTERVVRLPDLDGAAASAIGRPIADLSLYVLDEQKNLLPVGVPGEIYVAGPGVARGYLNRPELTAERFMDCPFRPGARMYRSGDLARRLPSGELDYLGRIDTQVKVRGFRIETGEIENVLRRSGLVQDVAVVTLKVDSDNELVAYVVGEATAAELRTAVRRELPEYMVPSAFVTLPAIPLTANGKVDRKALPAPRRASLRAPSSVEGQLEQQIAAVWREVLGLEEVGLDDSFFDLGGNSLRVVLVANALRERLARPIAVAQLFQHLTVRALAEHLRRVGSAQRTSTLPRPTNFDEPIAIVGMAGRFPGAPDLKALWRNLSEGVESVTQFAPHELDPSVPRAESARPEYVSARPILEGAELFDASFFAVTAQEAAVIDPQQRILLELAWMALDDAGCDPARYPGEIGIWAGEYNVDYYTRNVLTRPDVVARTGAFTAMTGNEKDFVATRIAHKLDLRGPAISVHTACSTSLVAIAQAFYALRSQQCDVALAGAASIAFPQRQGHLYDEGGMLSADGHCRPFDAEASGTMFGDGAGVVVLKRLSTALADGDQIYALLRGAAVNNDGAHKLSFSAPTVDGQANVITRALAVAGVGADEIDYVEAHGTATPLGDPIEVEALTQAFRKHTDARQFCALGSVKSNVGHLTAAAGVTGLIKTVLALKHELLPKTLHFSRGNPRIDFENSPFEVLAEARPWPRGGRVRRAGVSSFGVGGTNAHVIVEEAPLLSQTPARGSELLVLSARNEPELELQTAQLAAQLASAPFDLRDVAFTLATGRRAFPVRRVVVVSEQGELAAALPKAPLETASTRPLVFVFPGQGAQHVDMGRFLYESEPAFRVAFDRAAECASLALGRDLRAAIFCAGDEAAASAILRETQLTQPALFVVSYALAQLFAAHGVRPELLVGHSVGEFVAATLAGVMQLEDALSLVVARGRLMQSMERGSMLAVRMSADAISARLADHPALALAAVNAPKLCVVAGPDEPLARLAGALEAEGLPISRLHTSHAFHSPMMDPALEPMLEHVRKIQLSPPQIPIVSTVTGALLSAEQACDPHYWASQLRHTVRFADAVQQVWRADPKRVLLEVGPRGTLTPLMRQCAAELDKPQPGARPALRAVASLDARTGAGERASWLACLGQLWALGQPVALEALHPPGAHHVSLPSYPFQRKRHFVEPGPAASATLPPASISPPEYSDVPHRIPIADTVTTQPTRAGGGAQAQLVEEQLRLMVWQLKILAERGVNSI